MPSPTSPPKRAKWCSSCEAILIETLKKEALKQKQSDTGWKKSTWTECTTALQGSELLCGGAPKKESSCRDHFAALKKQARDIKILRNLSGFGWDEDMMCVTASDEVWDEYLTAHPEFACYRNRRFPLYDDVLTLIEGRYATGEAALAIPEVTDLDLDHNDDQDDIAPGIPVTETSQDISDSALSQEWVLTDVEEDGGEEASSQKPVKTPLKKRKRSPSPPPSTLKRQNSQRGRFPEIEKLATALDNIASACATLTPPSDTSISTNAVTAASPSVTVTTDVADLTVIPVMSTPHRRRLVIQFIESEGAFDVRAQARALRLLREKRGVVDNFLDIKGKELRLEYLHEELDFFN